MPRKQNRNPLLTPDLDELSTICMNRRGNNHFEEGEKARKARKKPNTD